MLKAVYSGDTTFNGSNITITQTVNALQSTTTTLSSNLNPSISGQSVTFTATVTSGATGTVTFSIDSVNQPAVVLSGNQATLMVSNLSVGTHQIGAAYSGDTNFLPSSTTTLTQTVNSPPAGTVTLTPSANPSVVNHSVTFTAAVSSGATGTITFSIDGAAQAPVAVSNSQAQLATSTLSVGTHLIVAAYSGDTHFSPATSNPLSQVVNSLATPTVNLISSNNPAILGQTVTFTATVTSGATGTVTFTVDSVAGSAIPLSGTQAQLIISTFTLGNHTVSASYSGDQNYSPGASNIVTQVVNQQAANITLSASPNPSAFGQTVTFTAGVPAGATGAVTFTIDGTAQAPIDISAGQVTLTVSNLTVGKHTLGAGYSGDSNFAPASAAPLTQTVAQQATIVALISSLDPSIPGVPVTFTASVPAGATGTITFTIDGVSQGTLNVTAGSAQITASSLTGGNHTVIATYSGDANFLPATSSPLTQIVVIPQVTLTLASSANPAVVGQPITFTATISIDLGANANLTAVFFAGTTPIGTAPFVGTQAVFTFSKLPAGSYDIVVKIAGAFLQASIGQVVNGMSTTTTVSATPATVLFGQAVVLGAQVGPAPPGGVLPETGTVSFQDNGAPLGTATLIPTKGAVLPVNALAAGSHVITAVYSGDKFWSSSFGRITLNVTPPVLKFSSTAADLESSLAPDEAVSIFNVTVLRTDAKATTLPLPVTLGAAAVAVTDSAGTTRPAQLYGVFSSAQQVNFIVPAATALGAATIKITGLGGTLSKQVSITRTAPGLFSADGTGTGVYAGQVVYAHADGTQTVDTSAVFHSTNKAFVPKPVNLGTAGDKVFLVLYGTGIRHRTSDANTTATVKGARVPAISVPQPGTPGLDQVNLQLPASLAGSGPVDIVLVADGQTSNTVSVTIQ
jgi:uncharacterized protein (TIGR03437 family)